MIFEYGKAPMHYVEGIPANKAGEWAGKLSCKFGATRKAIRPKMEGIIFNENEPLIMPKKRLLSKGPSKEKEFIPCIRIIRRENDANEKESRIRIFKPVYSQGKGRPEKVHYFQYREEHVKALQEIEKESNGKQMLSEEFKVLNKIGFSKKTLDSLPNNKLLGLNFSKDYNSFNFSSKGSEFKKDNRVVLDKVAKGLWQKQQNEQMNNIRIEKDNLRKDMDYVKKLETWEKGFLPKVK